MLIRVRTGEITHHTFRELPSLLAETDLLVFNETKVIPALLKGRKLTGGHVELLVLDPARGPERTNTGNSTTRVCMVSSSKPIRPGTEITISSGVKVIAEEAVAPGRVRMHFPLTENMLLDFLESHGQPPLPPYIKLHNRDLSRDRDRYQTVYATTPGSIAAPTAGLHFTEDLLAELRSRNRPMTQVLLHVGPGTFTPIRDDDIRLHEMEPEYYEILEPAAGLIRETHKKKRLTIAVGTTTVRALESAASESGAVKSGKGETRLFIMPGHEFKVAGGLLTNFHLPGSTLLVLVCAFAGTDLIMKAYQAAVRERYRFYSYGDACLILP